MFSINQIISNTIDWYGWIGPKHRYFYIPVGDWTGGFGAIRFGGDKRYDVCNIS